tara:strand:- start:217 stop:489 length:273 start_codon:yes stop_codon:yes gene_type:complete
MEREKIKCPRLNESPIMLNESLSYPPTREVVVLFDDKYNNPCKIMCNEYLTPTHTEDAGNKYLKKGGCRLKKDTEDSYSKCMLSEWKKIK